MDFEPMNIYAAPGTKVRYKAKNGFDGQRSYADRYLVAENVYTVDHTEVGGWTSSVVLVEVPDKRFNTVMFEEVE